MHSLLRNKGRIDSLGATATMAQLVEQRIRNAWVAGSSPASGSLSWYPLGTSFFCITESRPQGSCGPCIVCWQDGIDPYIISVLIRPWNARSANGTPASDYWNAAQRHTLTLKCVNFVNFVNFWKEKSHRFRDGIFLIYPQQNLFVFSGTPEISDFWGEEE